MQRCLQLAAIGEQWVAPNPMVGAVVVKQDTIIGEGYHQQFGGAHAEVNAIHAVKDKALLEGATIYVSLEPCVHFGKTPPCTNLIIEHKISKVVIACLDPNPLVAGKGVAQLKQAGIEVIVGVLENESLTLNKRFIFFHRYKKPFVILKWAQTEDGYCGRLQGSGLSGKISSWYSDVLVHQMRSKESAILVGYNTALFDNPRLNTRKWFGKNPLRVVIDLEGKLPKHLQLFTDTDETLIFTLQPLQQTISTKNYIKLNEKENLTDAILETLFQKNIQSVIVEGGPKTLQEFINNKAWNEAHIFTSTATWGKGIKAPILNSGTVVYNQSILNDNYKIVKSENNL